MSRSSILLLLAPFDSGERGARTGAGLAALARAGAAARLRARGHDVEQRDALLPASQWLTFLHPEPYTHSSDSDLETVYATVRRWAE